MTFSSQRIIEHLNMAKEIMEPLKVMPDEVSEKQQEVIGKLTDVRAHLFCVLEGLYQNWVKEANTPSAWYHYSVFLKREHVHFDLVFEAASKGVKVLEHEKQVFGALSKHYIQLLQVAGGKEKEIQKEISRIDKIRGVDQDYLAYLLGENE